MLMGEYNYKNPLLAITAEDIPYEAIDLFKREEKILGYKRDIEDIVYWSVINISV